MINLGENDLINTLPNEILENIFQYVGAKVARVCKRWKDINEHRLQLVEKYIEKKGKGSTANQRISYLFSNLIFEIKYLLGENTLRIKLETYGMDSPYTFNL